MEQDRLEHNVKSSLEKRTISPSKESWNKVSDRLDAYEKAKNKKYYWRYAIAASTIILLSLSLFFRGVNKKLDPDILADENNERIDIIKGQKELHITPKVEILTNTIHDKKNNQGDTNYSEPKTKQPVLISKALLKNENSIYQKEVLNSIGSQENQMPSDRYSIIEENTLKKPNHQNSIIPEVKKEIAIDIALQNASDNTDELTEVSDKEIDVLLKSAMQGIYNDKKTNISYINVDARALLLEAELDIDYSIKDRIFKILEYSYKEVRTAVADRNK